MMQRELQKWHGYACIKVVELLKQFHVGLLFYSTCTSTTESGTNGRQKPASHLAS